MNHATVEEGARAFISRLRFSIFSQGSIPYEPVSARVDAQRSAASAQLIYQVARSRGVPVRACLRGSGLTDTALNDSDALITASQELRLIDNVLGAIDDPTLGIDIGRRHTIGSFGIVAFGVLSSATVRSGLEFSMTYRRLAFIFTDPIMHSSGRHTKIVLPHPDAAVNTVHFLADLFTATLAAVLRALAPGHQPFRSITLPRQAPPNPGAWTSALGVCPRFASPTTMAIFDPDTLDYRLPTSDAQARLYCEKRCTELLTQRRRQLGLADQVRNHLLRHKGAPITQQQVARDLGLADRTLHRKLAAEGISFRQLRDEALCALAQEMLTQRQLSLAQIASALGYEHSASFTRAYRRWTGHRPSDDRR